MKEDTEIPINISEVFSALAQRDLLQAADMRDLEQRAKELTERTSNPSPPVNEETNGAPPP